MKQHENNGCFIHKSLEEATVSKIERFILIKLT